MTYTSAIKQCGTDHSTWTQSLDFYRDDINILNKRLEEIIRKNTGKEVSVSTEHFQNQFLIQAKNISELKHGIRAHDGQVADQISRHAGKISTAAAEEHTALAARVSELQAGIDALRQEFNRFAAEWM